MFGRINLEKELRNKGGFTEHVLPNLNELYCNDRRRTLSISYRLLSEEGYIANFCDYDMNNIFTLSEIKDLCIRYNLRFLDSSLFKGEVPIDAINKIKYIEDTTDQSLTKFSIMAPAKRFNLEDENSDPLLFADLGNSQFLFIHKWGNDLKWYNQLLSFPTQSYMHLAGTMVFFTLVLSLLVPNSWLSTIEVPYFNFFRVLFFFWVSILSMGVTAFVWMSFRRNVATDVWDQKTF